MTVRLSHRQPSYRKHKPTGQAVVTLGGRDHYLGRYGSAASRAAYDRLISEWLANGRRVRGGAAVTVAEVIKAYWAHAQKHYRRADGTQTSEVSEIRQSLRPIRHLYGEIPASDFGPLKLKAVRELMISGYDHPRHGAQPAIARGVINHRIERIKRMFRWATEEELVPASIYQALRAVQGLKAGRTKARETEPVRPVDEALVEAVRPLVSRQVRALIDLQLLTGARPGELCGLRGCDVDCSGALWVARPEQHKTIHRGHVREIFFGPKAQAILAEFLRDDAEAFLFSPTEAERERYAGMRAVRKTKVQPSQRNRRKAKPQRTTGESYDVAAYRRAIARACERAFPLPEDLGPQSEADGKVESQQAWAARLTEAQRKAVKAWRKSHSWHPHQLRHNAATHIRREFGVEVARIILGHRTAFTTEIYAEADRAKAKEAIGKVG